jgi:hypothetical protein
MEPFEDLRNPSPGRRRYRLAGSPTRKERRMHVVDQLEHEGA